MIQRSLRLKYEPFSELPGAPCMTWSVADRGWGAVRLGTETCRESEPLKMQNYGRGGVLSDSEAARLAEEEENVRSRIQQVARALVYVCVPVRSVLE